ncbi:hypothetical protein LTR96_005867 [Exophiala xenobiotica]|uniref:Cytochrome P450 n=1 Tax=Vermiconidia calcicola TaxID=1690605 RepID=A0AAV9PWN2_9PEZI|nr:hypothetical protein H2202_001861 [Exophiala xenobiotica]KAK5530967.1 hypothetical protein LTR25_008824 [Vermiconidia calcicola]KAK5544459.1 hypothetical protein LTR23_004547 [Chaetothyriales sp. CCFEE 6169]KAK5259445.1 hypothetical protein LTR40_005979 [Exophiala xenobiotica]KAK5269083.1 hypothetical protein LTR96_005867 [Exophiala xenobiotica]
MSSPRLDLLLLENITNRHLLITTLVTLITVSLYYALLKITHIVYNLHTARRHRWLDIPTLPRHPLWGNLINMGSKLQPSLNRHPDYGFVEIWNALNQPDAFLMDMLPLDNCFLVVAHPAVAETLVQPLVQPLPGSSPGTPGSGSKGYKYSIPKSDTIRTLWRLIGLESMIIADGEEWRGLRKRFNRGFAPAHLHSLAPLIVSKTRIFVDRLKAVAAQAQSPDVEAKTFILKDFAQDLTTDIITEVTIEKDFHAQSTPNGQGHKGPLGMLTASRKLSGLVYPLGRGLGWHLVDPIRPVRAWFYEMVYNRELGKVVREQVANEQALQDEKEVGENEGGEDEEERPKQTQQQSKSITRLALSGMTPSNALLRNTVSQIKSFLFAGQDTTATLIQWLCFELSKATWSDRHAEILDKLVAEHDAVFGKTEDPSSAFNALDVLGREDDDEGRREAESILGGSKLPYTTAFIKETLRLHPPASTVRLVPEITPSNPVPVNVRIRNSNTKDGGGGGGDSEKEINVNGLRVYVAAYLIHRHKGIWGEDADVFRPDRWLDDEYMSKLPSGAWRPFERGPRNCIGQELAMLEAKIVLCAVARGFKWEKVGHSGRKGFDGQLPQGDGSDDPDMEVWSISNVTAVPLDGMKMKVERR